MKYYSYRALLRGKHFYFMLDPISRHISKTTICSSITIINPCLGGVDRVVSNQRGRPNATHSEVSHQALYSVLYKCCWEPMIRWGDIRQKYCEIFFTVQRLRGTDDPFGRYPPEIRLLRQGNISWNEGGFGQIFGFQPYVRVVGFHLWRNDN